MPTSSKPETSAIHRVLIDSGADPKLIHPAIEEMCDLSGQNVTAAIGTQIAGVRADLQAQIAEVRADLQAQIAEVRTDLQAQIADLRSEMRSQITGLRAEMNSLNKVIWPLISLLFIPMLALAYKILMS